MSATEERNVKSPLCSSRWAVPLPSSSPCAFSAVSLAWPLLSTATGHTDHRTIVPEDSPAVVEDSPEDFPEGTEGPMDDPDTDGQDMVTVPVTAEASTAEILNILAQYFS